ncbi:MAG TPA: flavin reductase family protein [Phycisphaerales bacterium]|nr:flavin reductase family protein [Phycisphaerales bacterium]
MVRRSVPEHARAIGLVPSGVFVLTAEYEGLRAGLLVHWVQQAGFDPPLMTVAVPKGQTIGPLIRDAHAFALCQVARGDRLLERKFMSEEMPAGDPFISLETVTLATGAPVLTRALAAFDCRVVRHLDFESDHEFFVGEVVAARILDREGRPAVHLRENGLGY